MSNMSNRQFRKQMREYAAAHDKEIAELREILAESARTHEESKKEFEKRWKRHEQEFGDLSRSYGDQVEAMFVNLSGKFNVYGHNFTSEARNTKYFAENGKVLTEVDRKMENGDSILLVEVKAKLKKDDVDDHIERLGIISEHCKRLNDHRKVIGAVAGGIIPENLLKYAQNRGLYVLVLNGDNVEVADMPAGFRPKEW